MPGDEVRVEAELHSAPVFGDPQLMERLVANLVDNAVRHNHQEGARSWIRLWTGLDGGRPVLRIADSGRGLGLGLSIVVAVKVTLPPR
ncbi:hypothetical protein AQJ27_21480 [Streptomyces olivochromogenes]|nr:hypothetical protein AQJ27_21480 [Streptomyces olivochromogenes]